VSPNAVLGGALAVEEPTPLGLHGRTRLALAITPAGFILETTQVHGSGVHGSRVHGSAVGKA
jgi:hypothetical protein